MLSRFLSAAFFLVLISASGFCTKQVNVSAVIENAALQATIPDQLLVIRPDEDGFVAFTIVNHDNFAYQRDVDVGGSLALLLKSSQNSQGPVGGGENETTLFQFKSNINQTQTGFVIYSLEYMEGNVSKKLSYSFKLTVNVGEVPVGGLPTVCSLDLVLNKDSFIPSEKVIVTAYTNQGGTVRFLVYDEFLNLAGAANVSTLNDVASAAFTVTNGFLNGTYRVAAYFDAPECFSFDYLGFNVHTTTIGNLSIPVDLNLKAGFEREAFSVCKDGSYKGLVFEYCLNGSLPPGMAVELGSVVSNFSMESGDLVVTPAVPMYSYDFMRSLQDNNTALSDKLIAAQAQGVEVLKGECERNRADAAEWANQSVQCQTVLVGEKYTSGLWNGIPVGFVAGCVVGVAVLLLVTKFLAAKKDPIEGILR